MVRTDARLQAGSVDAFTDHAAAALLPDGQTSTLTSVRELWADVIAGAHAALAEVVRRLTLAGGLSRTSTRPTLNLLPLLLLLRVSHATAPDLGPIRACSQ